MIESLENVASRLRGRNYPPEVRRLVEDLASALEAQARLPQFRRGLAGGVLAGQGGGTRLDVGDPSAANVSASLQQPATGQTSRSGALATRVQARAEVYKRTLPGVVVGSTQTATDVTLTVYVPRGEGPTLGVDPGTGQPTALVPTFGDLNDVAAQAKAGTLPAAAVAQAVQVVVPRPAAVDGHQPSYANGQIIQVDQATQYDRRTVWVEHDERMMAIDSKREGQTSYSVAALQPCCASGGGGGDS